MHIECKHQQLPNRILPSSEVLQPKRRNPKTSSELPTLFNPHFNDEDRIKIQVATTDFKKSTNPIYGDKST